MTNEKKHEHENLLVDALKKKKIVWLYSKEKAPN